MPASLSLRGLAAGILAGVASAALFFFVRAPEDAILGFLASFSVMPLFIAGLGTGVISGIAAVAAGAATLIALKGAYLAWLYMIVYGLPTVALTAMALRRRAGANSNVEWGFEGDLLTAVTLYPCVIFLALYAALAGQDGGLLGYTVRRMAEEIAPYKAALDADVFAGFLNFTKVITRFMPAILGCFWMLVMLFSIVIAQSILKKQAWNLRPEFDFRKISVPGWIIIAAALAGLTGALAPAPYDYVGVNLFAVLVMPLLFVGMAIVHTWAAPKKAKVGILILFYLLMVLPFTSILLSITMLFLGIADQWFDFRRRFLTQRGG